MSNRHLSVTLEKHTTWANSWLVLFYLGSGCGDEWSFFCTENKPRHFPVVSMQSCFNIGHLNLSKQNQICGPHFVSNVFLCPRHSKYSGGALSVTPVRPSVRPSVIKIWCPLNNFWKTASVQFKFGMLIYNIKTQVEFDLGYNPLIFDRVMGLL